MNFDIFFRFVALPLMGFGGGLVLIREIGRLFSELREEASVELLDRTKEAFRV